MECSACNLCQYSDPTQIPGSGNKKAKIMIINSYASDIDEQNQKATPSSHTLEFLKRAGLNMSEIYYTNAIKCRTPKGTKYKAGDIKKCKVHLDAEIAEVKPQYVLVIGAQALAATVGGSITQLSGVTIEVGHVKYIPTYSPGIVYRDPGKAPFVTQALNNFISLIEGQERKLPELNIKVLTTKAAIKKAFDNSAGKIFSYDIETSGLSRFEEVIRLLGFGNDDVQYIIPLETKFSPLKGKRLLQKKLVSYAIKRLNTDLKARIAANGKFDNLFLKYHFKVKPLLDFDVVLASHILNENTPNGVKENAVLECNALDWDIDKNLKQGNVQTPEDYDKYLTYLGYDIYYEYKLYRSFKPRIKEDKALLKLFTHLYMPVIRAYEDIEEHGVYIYTSQFKEARRYLEGELIKIEKALAKHKADVNWGSPKQIAQFLYGDLGLPILEKTPTGAPSTSEATLMQLRDKHSAVELMLQHRGVKIQISHFIDGWINRMQKGRLHPNFKLLTVTGRTSCTDPNLQQVPRDPRIRNLIGAPPGRTFLEADFSQAELRIAAILSGDTEMKRIYQTGGDIHTHTYELVSGQKLSSDKYEAKEQRKKAKAVNFGFLYGMGWMKFKDYARDTYGIKLSEAEAKQYRTKFFQVYKSLPEWHQRQRRIVKAMGQVRNPIGRLRRLPDIYSNDQGKRAEAERQSINSPVQGFGSDLTLLGMAEANGYALLSHEHLQLDKSKFDCVGTVHDSTLFEVDNDYLLEFIPKVKTMMEDPKALNEVFQFTSPVPIVVDISIGNSWGAGTELDFKNDKWMQQVKDYLQM